MASPDQSECLSTTPDASVARFVVFGGGRFRGRVHLGRPGAWPVQQLRMLSWFHAASDTVPCLESSVMVVLPRALESWEF